MGGEDPLEKEMATHSVSLPGKSHEQRSLVGCSPWGCKQSDKTKPLNNKKVKPGKTDIVHKYYWPGTSHWVKKLGDIYLI